ncbi:MAG: DUF354 domain-containing protein [Pyrinomonadaceae bacterium]
MNANKAIWIDLDNSPHVPLFIPLIEHYRGLGVEVILTARDHAQTVELLTLSGLAGTFSVVGKHYGKSKLNKVRGVVERAVELARSVRSRKVAVAISHGSRSMILAARWSRIPVISMYDYEFTETRIFNLLSDRVIVPDGIPESVLDQIGLPKKKRARYPGIKEELYLSRYQRIEDGPRNLRAKLGLKSTEATLVVLRPPATTANYHSNNSDLIFAALIERLLSTAGIFTVIVPRSAEQRAEIVQMASGLDKARERHVILDKAVNGLDLIDAADVVVSGGGTMNREAVLLGVPVYSIFAGRLGSLDARMEEDGLITFVRDASEIANIKLRRRDRPAMLKLTNRVERFVIGEIDSFL